MRPTPDSWRVCIAAREYESRRSSISIHYSLPVRKQSRCSRHPTATWLARSNTRAVFHAGDTTDFVKLSVGIRWGCCGENRAAEHEPQVLIVDYGHHCQGVEHSRETFDDAPLKFYSRYWAFLDH